MRKRFAAAALLGLAAATAYGACSGNAKELARVRAEVRQLATQRDSLDRVVRDRDARRTAIARDRDAHRAEADRLRDSVRAIERRRAERQLTLTHLRTVGALQDTLRAVFPELGARGWGFTTVAIDDGDTLGLEVLVVPAWFAQTFAIDRVNAESWRAQKDRLLAVDSLQQTVTLLHDSITSLERANRVAYETGYRAASASVDDLSRRYAAELRKPRFTLGRTIGLVAAVGAGVVLGRALP
jgi:hypothetical protein